MMPHEYEAKYRRSIGCPEYITISLLKAEIEKLGYTFDRTMDCRFTAQYISGERIGRSYPAMNTGLIEMDTGLSAFHYQARRDENFERLQELRRVGAFVEVRHYPPCIFEQ